MEREDDPTRIYYDRPLVENPLVAYNINRVGKTRHTLSMEVHRRSRGREVSGLRDWILILLAITLFTGPILTLAIAEIIARIIFNHW